MSVNEPKVRRRIISLLIFLLSLSGLISFALLTESDPHLSAMANPPGLLQVQVASGSRPVNIPIVDENTHDRQQAEPTIAIDPRNPDIIVAGAQAYRLMDFNQHRWHGYYLSTDGGQTWTSELLPGFPGDNSHDGMASPLHRSKTLSNPGLAFDPVTGASLNHVQVSKVTNSGTVLAQNVKVVTSACFLGLSSTLPGGSFRDFTIPQIVSDSKAVYLVRDDCGLGNSNVLFTKSMDGGSTWTASIMVNDFVTDTRTCCVSTQHFFPSIAVSGGIINIAWYDSRQNNATSLNALDIFYAYSLNGGLSFSPNIRITTVSFDPNFVKRSDAPNNNEPFIGDYIQITATPIRVHVIWTDNRFACDTVILGYGCQDQDVITAGIDLPDFSLTTSPPSMTLIQGQTAATNVTLTSLSGFSGNVTIALSTSTEGLPTTTLAPRRVDLSPDTKISFLLSFSPTFATPAQTYTMNITGSSAPRLHTADFSVTVKPFATFHSPGYIRFPSLGGPIAIYAVFGAAFVTVGVAVVAGLLIFDRLKRRRASPRKISSPANQFH